MNNMENIIFELIARAGTARSDSFEALYNARDGKFEDAVEKLKAADTELTKAHHIQTDIIQREARGEEKMELSFLMVHAQDHLMTSMLAKDLIVEMIKMCKLNTELMKKIEYLTEKKEA